MWFEIIVIFVANNPIIVYYIVLYPFQIKRRFLDEDENDSVYQKDKETSIRTILTNFSVSSHKHGSYLITQVTSTGILLKLWNFRK